MIQLSPKQSRAAAALLLAAVVLLIAAIVAAPLWMLNRRYDAALDDTVSRLERYAKIAGMRDGLVKKSAQVQVLAQSHHYLKSASPALAAAELQEQVKVILEANGGKLNSIQILPHKDDGQYRQISVQLQLSASLAAVKAMLYALESSRPYLFIDNFSARSTAGFGPRTGADPAVEPDLTVQFDLTGYALKGTP